MVWVPRAARAGRSTYGLADQSIEAGVTATASRFMEMAVTARWMNAEVGPGKVFSDSDDLNFSDMRSGYGFGIRGHAPGGGGVSH